MKTFLKIPIYVNYAYHLISTYIHYIEIVQVTNSPEQLIII